MYMIEIAALSNGAHRNQTFNGTLLDGWAVIPDGMETENFPFGEVTAKEINGVMTVTKWTPGTMPEPDPQPDPQPTIDDRVTALEEALVITDETAIALYEAMMAQEEIYTAQDDALIELYEMIGG